jgi:hypothetical protein
MQLMEVEVTTAWIEATTLLSSALDAPIPFEINNAIPGNCLFSVLKRLIASRRQYN